MRAEVTPMYKAITRINDPVIRSFVYAVVDENWNEFYNKKIVGLSDKTAGMKGYQICYDLANMAQWVLSKQKTLQVKLNDDLIYMLCFVEPAWIGEHISEKKIADWQKVRNVYRRADFKARRPDWGYYLLTIFKEYPRDRSAERLIRDVFHEPENIREALVYWMIYILVTRRKEE